MRTNIEIDDELMKQAMVATGAATKKAAVEAALRKIIQLEGQKELLKLRGAIVWRGHDDDWFASDEEILAKRRMEEQDAAAENQTHPAASEMPASLMESR